MKISIKNGVSFFSSIAGLLLLTTANSAFAAPSSTPPSSLPAQPEQTLIVVDAIGQEQTTGQNKSEILQGIMHEIVTNRTMNLRIGLSRFDANKNPNCVIYNFYLASIDSAPKSMAKIVGQLFPPTDDPYTLAMAQAIAALGTGELESVVVVVGSSDGTCVPNPCSVSNLITHANSSFKTEVIGFESSSAQEAGLECLARTSQGSYDSAATPAALKAILKQKIAPLIRSPAQYGSVNLSVVSKETLQPIISNVRWWIYSSSVTGTAQPTVVQFSTQAAPHFQLTPGDYTVMVSYGEVSSKQSITIQSGQAQNVTLSVPTQGKIPSS